MGESVGGKGPEGKEVSAGGMGTAGTPRCWRLVNPPRGVPDQAVLERAFTREAIIKMRVLSRLWQR